MAPHALDLVLGPLARALVGLANAGLALTERLLWPRVPRRPARVAIWRVGMVGDTLAALPAVRAIRARHGDAHLTLLTSPGPRGAPGANELGAASCAVDEIWRWHREDLATPSGRRVWRARLRAGRFERTYFLPQELARPLPELARLAYLRRCGLGGLRGVRVANAGFLPRFLRRAHERTTTSTTEGARLLRSVGAPNGPADLDGLARDAARETRVASLLRARGLDRAPLLLLAPGAKLEKKRWPIERVDALARRWRTAGGTVACIGSASERELCEAVDATNLCGELDLLEAADCLRRAAAFCGNDSGLMHLAAEVRTPAVALFSGMDRPGVWHPNGDTTTVLQGWATCAPCYAAACREDRACLRAIEPDAVWVALLQRARERPAQAWEAA